MTTPQAHSSRVRSPLFNFILGTLVGVLAGTAITLHIATKQVQANTQEAVNAINSVKTTAEQNIQDVQAEWQKAVDAWKDRAEKCEVKERIATVIYEYQPSLAVPVLHGVVGITLGTEQNHPESDLKPVWVIPVQTPVYTNLAGARYAWIDGKSGARIGEFPATPPPASTP